MHRKPRWICLGVAVLVANTVGLVPAAQAQGKWANVAPFPDPREELLGAAAAGKMYVFAGLIPLWHPAGLVYAYDPATNQWNKRKPMALPSHHVAFTTYNDKIYAFGGFVYPESGPAAWVPIDNAFEYDPSRDSWKALAPMPIKRGAAVAATVGDKMYVIGGATTQPWAKDNFLNFTTPQRGLGTVHEYDPKTNTWRERASMPSIGIAPMRMKAVNSVSTSLTPSSEPAAGASFQGMPMAQASGEKITPRPFSTENT